MESFHTHIKKYLDKAIEEEKIPHTQLLVGAEGVGVLPFAIEYAAGIISQNKDEKIKERVRRLNHPDLIFFFPNTTTKKITKDPASSCFLEQWREFCQQMPYGNLSDWLEVLEVEKKQGQIGVSDAKQIVQKAATKPFEARKRVVIVWMAEMMNNECANKLLKILEEPPQDTIFLLIAQDKYKILPTVYSRCQVIDFAKPNHQSISEALQKKGVEKQKSEVIAHRCNGNFRKALLSLTQNRQEKDFERWFIWWMRTAYKAKANKKAIIPLIGWSEEIATQTRDTQKTFLDYCLEVFRQAFLYNYCGEKLVYMNFEDKGFKLEKFAPFLHNANIFEIRKEIETAALHIERNGNGKIIFTDLSIKLTRLIHKKRIV